MNCTEIREKFVEYIEGLLSDQQKQQLESHLKNCDQCQAELDQLTSLGKRLTSDSENKQSNDFENAVFNRIIREQNKKLKQTDGINRQLHIWRIIMKSKITKFTVAAMIVIAAFTGIYRFGSTIDGASVALADVAKKIEQMKNCVFKKTTTISSDNAVNTSESLSYYTKGAVRADIYDGEKITQQVYVNFPEGIIVGIDHKMKVFRKMNLADDDIKDLPPTTSPQDIANFILSKGEYKKLGRKTVNGVLSEGFEFNDKRAVLKMDKDKIKTIVMRLWVDVNTNLLVRVESDGVLINDSKVNVVMYDPQWDVELEPDFFEPKIPADYVEPQQRGFIGISLENWPTLKVNPGMAAEKAGIKDGDVVLKVNGQDIFNIKSSADAQNLLLGKVGEKAVLTVKRAEQIVTFEITREPLPK